MHGHNCLTNRKKLGQIYVTLLLLINVCIVEHGSSSLF